MDNRYQSLNTEGDPLEKAFYALISEKIPAYENIWQMYIGNDGSSRMRKASGLNLHQEKIRIQFSQYHYTCLQCFAGMFQIKEKIKSAEYEKIEDVLEQNINIFAFYALSGKIRDCVKKMGELFCLPTLAEKFEEIWTERCVHVHDKKLPYFIEDGLYLVLGNTKSFKNGSKEYSWYEMKPSDFEFLGDNFETTFDNVAVALNDSLESIFQKIKGLKKNSNFELLLSNNFPQPDGSSNFSSRNEPLHTSDMI